MSSQDSAYHSQSQGASTPNSEMQDSEIKDGSFDNSIKMNSSTINGYNSIPSHKIVSDGQIISKTDNSVNISVKIFNSSPNHNSDLVIKKEGDSNIHSSSSSLKHKDDISKSSNNISSKEHNGKKHEHSKGDSEKLKKDKSHHDSSKKVDKHHDDKHKEKSKDGHSSSGHSEHKHKEHKSKDGDHKSKERDKLKESSKNHDKSKHESSKDKLKKLDSHKEKHKDKSDAPKEKSDKPKEKSEKPKEKSDKPKEKSIDKHKEQSIDKHKERNEDKHHKEKSEHKHKEGEKSKDKIEKHKEKSDKPKDKIDKPKEKSDKPKEKSDKPKEKSDKPKEKSDKPKEKSDKPKEKSDKPKEKLDKLKEKLDKPKEKTDKPKEKTDKPKEKTDKPKEKTDKPKEKSDKPKEKSDKPKDKIVEKSKEKSISIKKESSPEKRTSPTKEHSKKESIPKPKLEMSITVETIGTSQVKMELESLPSSPQKQLKEDYSSEDDIPLSARKTVKQEKPTIKREIEESDDEPLSSRVSKAKKLKTEPSSAKKRKVVESDYEDDDGDDYAEEDYDSDYKKPTKKKVKKETKPKKAPAKAKNKKEEPSTPTASPTKRGRAKKEEETQDVWKWWEEEKHEDGVKWRTLEHKGPVFAPAYERVPKNVKFYYDGKHMELSEVAEEVAGFYGRMLDHDYVTKDSFNTNFFKDWRKVMTPEEREAIKDLKKCNFNDYNVYYKMKSEERKAMTKEEKQEIKKQNEALVQEYGFCVIDGHRQKIGNFKIEPPGLFRGRGEHPKMGMLKRRVQPEDISINIGKQAKIPEAPAGHKWKDVRHDNTVTWLCSWTENILGSTKYIMLNPSSKLKGEKDWQKYETARKLKNHADRIRKTYTDDFKSKEMKIRQRAVALYFIDKLALRAGNEKDEDTADTVGCCSLRVEHITLDEEKDGQDYVVSFDFLGKDSIRYFNSVPVEKRAFKNLKLFMENKNPGDDLFDRLNTSILNKYLNELMEGLTAKVFRTYNASKTLQEQLDLLTKEEMSIPEKLLAYNRANRAVAILCNHQRAVPKTFNKSMENLKTKIDDKIQQIRSCKKDLKQLKSDAKNSGSSKDNVLLDKKKKRLAQLEDQLKKLEVQATDKEENKQIALGTSKLNYLDPRISVAWCKKWDVPIEKIYNRTQRDKFRWAIEMAGPEFKF